MHAGSGKVIPSGSGRLRGSLSDALKPKRLQFCALTEPRVRVVTGLMTPDKDTEKGSLLGRTREPREDAVLGHVRPFPRMRSGVLS